MQHPGNLRARAVDAADVLNDFLGDFVTGVMVFREYHAEFQRGKLIDIQMVPIQKMCISNIVLAFAKFEEFWQHYSDVVPEPRRQACKNILKEIRERRITDFRNHCVGHIWNKQQRRPLTHSEVRTSLEFMVREDFAAFLNWINTPGGNEYPKTVVSIIETVRDAICAEHNVRPEEMIAR
jgi:hypothetical protein